jgi:tetratricopeptide (TPR) repeat protein
MLLLAGIVAGAVFLAVLLAAYLQTRALRRFAEIAQALPMNQALQLAGVPAAPLLGNGTAEANARLTVTIERLEKRIRELEGGQSTKPALTAGNAAGAAGTSAATGNIEALLAKGQSLLNAGQAAAAVACFDTALALDPQHTEVLVKKGAALEKLAKLDDAIACYDRAIAADGGLTIAYLYKGGVFNRLERYHEALACYEQALKTQERAPAA